MDLTYNKKQNFLEEKRMYKIYEEKKKNNTFKIIMTVIAATAAVVAFVAALMLWKMHRKAD